MLIQNFKYANRIAIGLAQRKNNMKNEKVINQAEDYGDLDRMLNHVKQMVNIRDMLFSSNKDESVQELKSGQKT